MYVFSASELPPCFWLVVWTRIRFGVAAQRHSVGVAMARHLAQPNSSGSPQSCLGPARTMGSRWKVSFMSRMHKDKVFVSEAQQERDSCLLREEYIDIGIEM